MPSINAHYAATAKPPKKSSMSVTIVPCSDLPAPVSRVYRIPRSYSRESYTLGRLVNRRRGGYKHRRGSNFNLCGAEGKRGEGTGEVDTSNGIEAREPHGSSFHFHAGTWKRRPGRSQKEESRRPLSVVASIQPARASPITIYPGGRVPESEFMLSRGTNRANL